MNDLIVEMLKDDIKDIKKDVKQLLAFKNRIYGVILFSSVLISLAVNLIPKLIP